MANPIPIINVESDEGKEFIQKVKELRSELFSEPTHDTEKYRYFEELSKRKRKKNKYLLSIMDNLSDQSKKVFDALRIKRVFIGNFGRKGSSLYSSIEEEYFRIILHLGDPEVYYLDSHEYSSHPVVLKEGEGLIFPPFISTQTDVSVYKNPIRILNDPELQSKLPKIRPKKYDRINLIYDFELDKSFFREMIENKRRERPKQNGDE